MANFKRLYPRKRGARRFLDSWTVRGRLHKHRRKGTQDMENVRTEIAEFAEAMEEQLKENDHKGGWSDLDPCWLFMRLEEEAAELAALLTESGEKDSEEVRREAADIANFAMMISDVCRSK